MQYVRSHYLFRFYKSGSDCEQRRTSKTIDTKKQEPLKLEILDFINKIENESEQKSEPKDAVNVTKIAELRTFI